MALRSRWWRSFIPYLDQVSKCRSVSLSATISTYHTLHNSCKQRKLSTICDITSSEALRALRPFYLAVHPDLFPQHPQERSTNEDSLKKLNSYLDALVVSGSGQESVVTPTTPALRPKPIQLTFFVKARQSGSLKSVSVSLDAYSVGSAVHDILQSCDLFTDISNPTISKLIRTKHQESEKHRVLSTYKCYKSHHQHHHQEPFQDYPDFDYIFSERNRTGSEHVQQKQPEYLKNWLKQNLSIARSRLDSSRCLREENKSLKEGIHSKHGLRYIEVNPDLTAATVKGHLLSLDKTLGVANSMDTLVAGSLAAAGGGGLKVVLGQSGSYVSVHGEVHLSCEETVQQWLQYLLRHAMRELAIVKEIDSLEKALLDMMNHTCKSLRVGGDISDINLRLTVKRPSTVTPSEYHSQLQEYITLCRLQLQPYDLQIATDDSRIGKNLDRSNTDDVIITIVNKSQAGLGELFLLEDGTVEVPVNCSLSALREFWSQNLHRICERRRKHERSRDEMLQAIQTCKQKLSLSDLRVKANINNDQIKSSCQRLLQLAQGDLGTAPTGISGEELNLIGHHLTLTNSYSVSSDGELRIPWDFKITS